MYPDTQAPEGPTIPIYPDAVPPIPLDREGWEAWTVADVLNFVLVLLWDPSSHDRAAGWGPHLDAAIAQVYAHPWPLETRSMPMKVGLVEYALRVTPQGASETSRELARLYAVLTWQDPSAADIIRRAQGRASDAVAQGVQQAAAVANQAAPALNGVGIAAAGIGLLFLISKLGR